MSSFNNKTIVFSFLIIGSYLPCVHTSNVISVRLKIVKILEKPHIQVRGNNGQVYTAIYSEALSKAYVDYNPNSQLLPRQVIGLDNGRPVSVTLTKYNNKHAIQRGLNFYEAIPVPGYPWYTIGLLIKPSLTSTS